MHQKVIVKDAEEVVRHVFHEQINVVIVHPAVQDFGRSQTVGQFALAVVEFIKLLRNVGLKVAVRDPREMAVGSAGAKPELGVCSHLWGNSVNVAM